jgi:hypothetical protein
MRRDEVALIIKRAAAGGMDRPAGVFLSLTGTSRHTHTKEKSYADLFPECATP